MPGRSPSGSRAETGRSSAPHLRSHLSQNRVRAVDCFDLPGQRQHITPMTVGMKQRLEQDIVGRRKGPFELRKPILRSGRGGVYFRLCQHAPPKQRSKPTPVEFTPVETQLRSRPYAGGEPMKSRLPTSTPHWRMMA